MSYDIVHAPTDTLMGRIVNTGVEGAVITTPDGDPVIAKHFDTIDLAQQFVEKEGPDMFKPLSPLISEEVVEAVLVRW